MLLVVGDITDHHQLARQFLIFDDENTVNINEHDTEKLWVSSAAENASYEWIRTLDGNVSLFCLNFYHHLTDEICKK